jgi:quercetin dioxygenase-like cupin family protein
MTDDVDAVTAAATVQIDNEFTRVTQWRFLPGTQTGMHTHELNYVVVPTIAGRLTVITPDGTSENVLEPGASYTRSVGSVHNVVNHTDTECAFVEVEFKN